MTNEDYYDIYKKRINEDASKIRTIKSIEQGILWKKGAICEKIRRQFPNDNDADVWSDTTDKGYAFSEQFVNYIIAYAYQLGQESVAEDFNKLTQEMQIALENIHSITDEFM